jgi:hypothetical protein
MATYGRTRRNLTSELLNGATDGALKKGRPDTSNITDDPTNEARSLLSHVEGGFDWSESQGDQHSYAAGYVRGA